MYIYCPSCQFRMLHHVRMCRVCGHIRDIQSVMRTIEDIKKLKADQCHDSPTLGKLLDRFTLTWMSGATATEDERIA